MPSADEPVFVPAPDLPAGPRSALVIATAEYTDSKLRRLRSPVKDAEDLAAVLADPAIGGFKVTQLIDQNESRVRREIAAFLLGRAADETVLIYLSCHGIQDRRGRLLFAATDTETRFPHASAIRATELLDELDECAATRQILILDCCFSGSFSGAKGDFDLERQLRGHSRGREVLTASRGFEYSFEGEPLDGAIAGSVFTTGLVEGLRTGAADSDKNGHITVEEAYDYAFGYVQRDGSPQTPQRWLFSGEGTKIVLARGAAGRAITPARLSEQIVTALESGSPFVRIGGVNALGEWLAGTDPARALAARRALTEIADNDIPRVAEVAGAYLGRAKPAEAKADVQAKAQAQPKEQAKAQAQPKEQAQPKTRPALENTAPHPAWISGDRAPLAIGVTTALRCVSFSPDGKVLASSTEGGTVRVTDVATGSQKYSVHIRWGTVPCVAFSPDGTLLASAGKGKGRAVRVAAAANGRELRTTLEGHSGAVLSVAFSPDGTLIASASEDRTVRVWHVATGVELSVLKRHAGVVRDVAFSASGMLLASAGDDKTIQVWDAVTYEHVRSLDGGAEIRGVAFSPGGTRLAAAGADGKVRVWEEVTGKGVRGFRALQGHAGAVNAVAFSPEGTMLASAGDDMTVRVWDAATGSQLSMLQGHSGAVTDVAFSPAEPLLASAAERTITLWR